MKEIDILLKKKASGLLSGDSTVNVGGGIVNTSALESSIIENNK
jgi:hypothetical protein